MQRVLSLALLPTFLLIALAGACDSGHSGDDDDGGDGGQSGADGGTLGGASGRGALGGRDGSGGTGMSDAGALGDSGAGNEAGAGGPAQGGSDNGTSGGESGADPLGSGNRTGDAGSPGNAGAGNGDGGTSGGGGTGGSSAGTGGGAGSSCGPFSIDGVSHHLGDGAESEGTTLTRSFDVGCACTSPWLSFQIDGPSRNAPPHIFFNESELPSLVSFYPALDGTDVWQSNGGSSWDYNGYLQIHYDVSGKVLSGSNTVTVTNGGAADDYNFTDLRLECGTPTTPPGPDVINRTGWVGYYPDRSGDDPAGIQGAIYGYGDGTSCTVPTNVCLGPGCCISGTTAATDPTTHWGCGLGMQLHSTGGDTPTELPYTGSATCFQLELVGSSGGSEVRVRAPNHSDMTNRTAPVVSLGAITGTTARTVCFSDFECPSDAEHPCDLSSTFYKLEVSVMGGEHAGAFDVCWRSLIPFTQ